MKKRIISIVLTLCMLLSVVPMMGITASAEATETKTLYLSGGKAYLLKVEDRSAYGTTSTPELTSEQYTQYGLSYDSTKKKWTFSDTTFHTTGQYGVYVAPADSGLTFEIIGEVNLSGADFGLFYNKTVVFTGTGTLNASNTSDKNNDRTDSLATPAGLHVGAFTISGCKINASGTHTGLRTTGKLSTGALADNDSVIFATGGVSAIRIYESYSACLSVYGNAEYNTFTDLVATTCTHTGSWIYQAKISDGVYAKSAVLVPLSSYLVNCATCENGSVSANKTATNKDETVTVTPTPNSGYAVDKVYYTPEGGSQTEITLADSKYTFTMPSSAVTVSATFKAIKYVCYIDKNENGTFDGSDVKYHNILSAINAAGTNETTIRMINDEFGTVIVSEDQKITLDLCDCICATSITNLGELTVTDSGKSKVRYAYDICSHNILVGKYCSDCGKVVEKSDYTYCSLFDSKIENVSDYTTVIGGCILSTGGIAISNGYSSAALVLNGGNIIGSQTCGISNTGIFTMNGGAVIKNNAHIGYAGGVNSDGSFIMNGGTIASNASASSAGGVYTKGSFEMNGGSIINNTSTAEDCAGGVLCDDFVMNGGLISGNTDITGYSTGGVCCTKNFTMTGGTIENNTGSYAGGCSADYAILSGGTITGNISDMLGGLLVTDTTTVGGDIKIYGNTGLYGNNMYVSSAINIGTSTIKNEGVPVPDEMLVGVILENGDGRFTKNGDATDIKYFFSDNDKYGVAYNDEGYLELVEIDYSTTPKMNYSANLTLAKNIDVGLTVAKNKDSAVAITAKKLKIYANGKEITLNDGLKGILASVVPNEIGKPIAVSVEYDGIIVKGFGYSVLSYCNAVFKAYANDNATYAKLNTLCEAILNYGKYAEDYYNQEGDGDRNADESTVNEGHEIDLSTVTLPTSKKVFTKNASYGDTGSSANLDLGSTIKLQYIVKATVPYELELVSGMTNAKAVEDGKYKTGDIPYMQSFFILTGEGNDKVQIDPSKIEVSETSGGYVISVDLYAYQLNKEYTLKVKDVDLTSFGITYGVYDYCVEAQEYCTEAVANLCKAIYNYSEAVSDYIG